MGPVTLSLSAHRRNEKGNVAMMMALCVIPLCMLVGLSFDTQRAQLAKSALQSAVDAASLAAARKMHENIEATEAVKIIAKDYFRADLVSSASHADCPDPVVNVDPTNYHVEVIADCSIQTTFAGFFGKDKWQFNASASAQSNVTRVDVALMLDVSGSMAGARLDALQASAKEAVDILLAVNTGNGGRIALAPYATSVNVGHYANNVVGSSYDPTKVSPDCVSERVGTNAATDTPAGPGSYVGYAATECPVAEIMPLTNNADALHDEIDDLTASGATAGHLGIAWSWYLISDKWDGFWGNNGIADQPGVQVTKAVVLMTDGAFNTVYDPAEGDPVQQAEAICNTMRTEGVVVYSVAFQAPPEGQAVLSNCATSPETYFEAETADQLTAVYNTIASRLGALRLVN